MIFKNRLVTLAGSAAVLAFAGACNPDLEVTNPNAPDVARAISTPGDVRQLIGSSFNTWYLTSQGNAEPVPGIAVGVMADSYTMAFGNFGARFNGQEPRLAFNNSSAAADGRVASSPYDGIYGALGAANDGLNAIKRGVKVAVNASAPDETPQMQAFAWMIQGMALGLEAQLFDQGFVVTEDTEQGTAVLEPYSAVAAAAVASLDKAIAASAGQSWTIAAEFTPGISLTASNFNKMANTMAARVLAYTPRTAAENAAVNWARVLAYADKGISTGTSFNLSIEGDGGVTWYDYDKLYNNLESWVRVDQRLVQLASGVAGAQPVVYTSINPPAALNSPDLRWGSAAANGTDFRFLNAIPYDPARGVYFFSQWAHKRYFDYSFEVDDFGLGSVPFVLAAENDLLIAEALVRTNGDKGRAATLVNKTRVGRGGLSALTGASSNNDLLAAIFYERDMELWGTGGGLPWFDRRRIDTNLTYNGILLGNTWGFAGGSNLQKGTPRSLPVPAKELETLGLPVYTYGGNTPNPIFPEF